METTIKFRCPSCKKSISAKEQLLGLIRPCPACAANIQVPALGYPKADLMAGHAQHMTSHSGSSPQQASRSDASQSEPIPVEIRLPGKLGGMKASVDQKTSNTMATTFLGGALVVLGAIVYAMLGGKGRLR